MTSLQDLYAPDLTCFGCGPKNQQGLRLKSLVDDDGLVASFWPKPHHQAFDNVLSGGICGTLLDCHSNWCAAYFIMIHRDQKHPPCTVTARYAVDLLHPTPMGTELIVRAKPAQVSHNKAKITAELYAGDQCTATCQGTFVAVSPGHPAYHRW